MNSKLVFSLVCIGSILLIAFSLYPNFSNEKTVAVKTDSSEVSGATLNIIKSQWQEIISEDGVQSAYQALDNLVAESVIDSHTLAHAFGEALYATEGLDGVSECDARFDFGCYHSFFGSAVYEHGIGVLPRFKEACLDAFGEKNLPCEHGIGHGVLAYVGYDHIDKALELCETVADQPTGGCYSGVFMEYNFHTMGFVNEDNYLRPVSDNLYEPCDSLDKKFQSSCYFEQVQWWQNVYLKDWQKIINLCSEINSDTNRQWCYSGIGHYAVTSSGYNLGAVIEECNLITDYNMKNYCYQGASWLLFSREETRADAYKLCTYLKNSDSDICARNLDNMPS